MEALSATVGRLTLLLALFACPFSAFAHRDDHYLQATFVFIEPDEARLQIHLTPGIAVAEQVITEIDRNRDGAIGENEAAAYAESLKRDLTLRLNGRNLELKLAAAAFAPPVELRTGSGIIRIEFTAVFGPVAAGLHGLTLENRHLSAMSVYLVNAVQPRSARVRITRQQRNQNQSAAKIEFAVHSRRKER